MTYQANDKVRVTGPTNNGQAWFIPAGTIATVTEDERYSHVRIRAEGHEPDMFGPDWQYPVSSVEPVEAGDPT